LDAEEVRAKVLAALRGVYDPEIPINVVDLGLIREVLVEEGAEGPLVKVRYTMTAPGCPLVQMISELIRSAVQAAAGEGAKVELVYEDFPPWTPADMTEEGREEFKKRFGYDIMESFLKQWGSVENYIEAVRKALGK